MIEPLHRMYSSNKHKPESEVEESTPDYLTPIPNHDYVTVIPPTESTPTGKDNPRREDVTGGATEMPSTRNREIQLAVVTFMAIVIVAVIIITPFLLGKPNAVDLDLDLLVDIRNISTSVMNLTYVLALETGGALILEDIRGKFVLHEVHSDGNIRYKDMYSFSSPLCLMTADGQNLISMKVEGEAIVLDLILDQYNNYRAMEMHHFPASPTDCIYTEKMKLLCIEGKSRLVLDINIKAKEQKVIRAFNEEPTSIQQYKSIYIMSFHGYMGIYSAEWDLIMTYTSPSSGDLQFGSFHDMIISPIGTLWAADPQKSKLLEYELKLSQSETMKDRKVDVGFFRLLVSKENDMEEPRYMSWHPNFERYLWIIDGHNVKRFKLQTTP